MKKIKKVKYPNHKPLPIEPLSNIIKSMPTIVHFYRQNRMSKNAKLLQDQVNELKGAINEYEKDLSTKSDRVEHQIVLDCMASCIQLMAMGLSLSLQLGIRHIKQKERGAKKDKSPRGA